MLQYLKIEAQDQNMDESFSDAIVVVESDEVLKQKKTRRRKAMKVTVLK